MSDPGTSPDVPTPTWYRGRAMVRGLCALWLVLPATAILLQLVDPDPRTLSLDLGRLGLVLVLLRFLYEGSIWALWTTVLLVGATGAQALAFALGGELTGVGLFLGILGALNLASVPLLLLSGAIQAYRLDVDAHRRSLA